MITQDKPVNVLTDEQIQEFQMILGEMKGGWAELKGLPTACKSLQDENTQLKQQMTDVRRLMVARASQAPRVRARGLVSDDCAQHLSAHFILHCERSGKLDGYQRFRLLRRAEPSSWTVRNRFECKRLRQVGADWRYADSG